MSVPIKIEKSAVSLPKGKYSETYDMYDFKCVTWKDRIILCDLDPSMLLCHHSGKWTNREMTGDVPINVYYGSPDVAQVVIDKMYVFDDDKIMHALDLHSWTRTTITPTGNLHTDSTRAINSWVYNGKIYYYQGYTVHKHQDMNQIICYNVSGNCWESTEQYGDIPLHRDNIAIISDDTVFLFGGLNSNALNDLYTLDMKRMKWTRVHGNTLIGPRSSRDHTFTLVSKSTAVVYGSTKFMMPDSWVLNLENAKQLKEPAAIWTKIPNHFPRFYHTAVLEPVSKSLWVMGGYASRDEPTLDVLLTMPFKLHSLQELAMNHILNYVKADDLRLGPEQLPKQLRNLMEDMRSDIKEGKLCILGEGSATCLCKDVKHISHAGVSMFPAPELGL